MCYAYLQTCPRCSWLLNITYPRCSHAKAYYLEPNACPMRMERRYVGGKLCGVCRMQGPDSPTYEKWRVKEEGDEGKGGEERGEMGIGKGQRKVKERRERESGDLVVRKDSPLEGKGVEDDEEEEYVPSVANDKGDSESDVSDDVPPTPPTRAFRAQRKRRTRTPSPRPPQAPPTPLSTPAQYPKRLHSPPSLTVAQIIEQEAAQRKRRVRRR